MQQEDKAQQERTHLPKALRMQRCSLMGSRTIEAAALAILLGKFNSALKFVKTYKSTPETHLTAFNATRALLLAYVKYTLKKDNPELVFSDNEISHLTKVTKWATEVLMRVNPKKPDEPQDLSETAILRKFFLITSLIGSYTLWKCRI